MVLEVVLVVLEVVLEVLELLLDVLEVLTPPTGGRRPPKRSSFKGPF